MTSKAYFTSAAVGVFSLALAAAGGFGAHAQPGAVNNAEAPVQAAPQSFADIVEKVAPAVVSIEVVAKAAPQPAALSQGQGFSFRLGPDGQGFQLVPPQEEQQRPVHGAGSGFFISGDGYVLTNNHVVGKAAKITVITTDGKRLDAHLVGTDPATDLAVIKVDGANHPFVSFEDSAKPRVGDWVIAIGNPLGLGGTATAGIVSALGRQHVENTSYVDFMQIDAPINRGNSGGPTFDTKGRVVGVNTAIASQSGGSIGIAFDIPADVAAHVSRELIDSGKVVRGYIGAEVQDMSPDIAVSLGREGEKGALIAQVTPGGPSDQAGLQSGDLVQRLNGSPVVSATDMTRQVGTVRPGEAIRLDIVRNGRPEQLVIHAGVRPSEDAIAANQLQAAPHDASAHGSTVLGMLLQPNPKGGVTVAGVRPDSDASDKGLSPGDVILSVGGRPVSSPADVAAAAAQATKDGRKAVLVLIDHGGRHAYVPLTANGLSDDG